jgi:ADP-ribose pyrophosphatase YjhB (NUDIX family)
MPKEPIESTNLINLGIVLNDKSEVLMIRRRHPEKGKDNSILKWAFPGGRQWSNESREIAVQREILEETGYDTKCLRQIDLSFHPQIHVIIIYHLCELKSQKPIANPKEAHEISEIRWVKPKKLKELITTSLNPKVAEELGI